MTTATAPTDTPAAPDAPLWAGWPCPWCQHPALALHPHALLTLYCQQCHRITTYYGGLPWP